MSAFGKLIPFLTVIIAAFAVFQLYTAIVFLSTRQYPIGSLNLVFSFAGLALARALWTNRRRM